MFGLENSGFLISLAVSLLISLVTLLYFRQQIATMDHKVTSMFSLLTSLTQELNNLSRISFNQQTLADTEDNSPITLKMNDSRINVSDDDENSESGDDSNSDSESSEEDENMLDEEEDEDESEELSLAELKTLNMGSEVHSFKHNTDDIKIIDMDTYSDEESSHNNDDESYDYGQQLEDVMNDMIEETIELNAETTHNMVIDNANVTQLITELDTIETDSLQDLELISDVKTFNIPLDYSKMSVKALKDLVAAKKLTTNVSKLKKPELIKLLSV